jgi:hypothetical protein
MQRLETNLKLLKILEEYLRQDPGMRFNQALLNLDFVINGKDDYYTEPEEIINRVLLALKK